MLLLLTASTEACKGLMAYSLILSCCCYTCCVRVKLRKMLNITVSLWACAPCRSFCFDYFSIPLWDAISEGYSHRIEDWVSLYTFVEHCIILMPNPIKPKSFLLKLSAYLILQGGIFDDFLSHFMCCCCALVQEWREVEIRGVYGG